MPGMPVTALVSIVLPALTWPISATWVRKDSASRKRAVAAARWSGTTIVSSRVSSDLIDARCASSRITPVSVELVDPPR